jgi:hypothetical protein
VPIASGHDHGAWRRTPDRRAIASKVVMADLWQGTGEPGRHERMIAGEAAMRGDPDRHA